MVGFESYEYNADASFHNYEFYSEGPKGKISKMVRFTSFVGNIYQISFGDVHSGTDRMNDQTVSGNGDMVKVIFTVAKVIYEFTEIFPKAEICFTGSTKSRTRLYQMLINKHKHLIQTVFDIVGYYNGVEETFNSGRNYDFVAVCRKSLNN